MKRFDHSDVIEDFREGGTSEPSISCSDVSVMLVQVERSRSIFSDIIVFA